MASGGIFDSLGFTTQEKRHIFYFICIPTRIILAILTSVVPRSLLVVSSLTSTYLNGVKVIKQDNKVWWNRRTHLLFSLSLLFISISNLPQYYFSIVMLIDVAFGLYSSLILKNAFQKL